MAHFAGNRVIAFKHSEDKKTIVVTGTGEPDRYKVVRGLSARDHITDTRYMTRDELKEVFVDALIMGYDLITNQLFEKGVLDCLPPQSLKILQDTKGNIVSVDGTLRIENPDDIAKEVVSCGSFSNHTTYDQ
jgi:hypothetical protein